jgi:HEAT repeat protein
MLRAISSACTTTLFAVTLSFAQSRPGPLLDPAVVAGVDRLYPGFDEILETCEPISLERLSRVLSENPSRDSLAVLLGLLESCPGWSAPDGQGHPAVSRLGNMTRAVGELPLTPVARALRTGNLNQRTTAAVLLSGAAEFIQQRDRGAFEQALIGALSDPDMSIREFVVGRLRLIGSVAGQVAIARSLSDPNVTSTYRYQATGAANVDELLMPGRLAQLGIDELLALLTRPDPDVRGGVAERIAWLLGNSSPKQMAAMDQERIVTAMIERLRDPSMKVRMAALSVLARTRASSAVAPLIQSLTDPNIPEYYLRTAIETLAALGSRDALPVLEGLTRPSQPWHIRQGAASSYIKIAKPVDAASDVRRLLWEVPDTALEKDVLARGRAALPRVWDALAKGSAPERRIAAALLGSFADVKSVRPIVTALAQSPGAVTRDQLLFDLNMILLAEGAPAPSEQRNAIAVAHLRWLYAQIAAGASEANSRAIILGQQAITVFPDRVVAPFSTELSAQVSASLASSADAFREAISKGVTGVAFHGITVVDDVARVGATLYGRLPNGGVVTPMWIGLYRRNGDAWIPMSVPSFHVFRYDGMLNRPNVLPTINRNYGADEPLKRLRLDLAMERIRVDLRESSLLRSENLLPGSSGAIDRSYVPLLERYKRSDASSVRYTAELESTKLTGQVNVQLWIDALAQSGTPYQAMAQQVLADYITRQITAEGRTLAGPERDELVTAASNAEVDARLLPRPVVQREDIRLVRRSDRFAMIEVAVGVGPRSGSGYTMLFERRGQRWVFLCLARMWIA